MYIVEVTTNSGRERYVFEKKPDQTAAATGDELQLSDGTRTVLLNRNAMNTIDIRPIEANEIENAVRGRDSIRIGP